jgi:sulfur-carrier protein
MKIRSYAYFREMLGGQEITWNRPAATLGDLLSDLSRQHGMPFRRWVYEDNGRSDKLSHLVIIMVNGRDVRDGLGIDTPLKPEDTIIMFPPLAGG